MLKIAPAHVGRVNKLVCQLCCCYDRGNCILLDDGEPHRCVQTISITGIYCNYFKRAVVIFHEEWEFRKRAVESVRNS